ncbi:TPA: hypothetical protein PWY45_002452 [Mannheimia haemolytica]|uniref:Phage antitermination protein Q n=3 Tax=Mannheimia haemolytica TaxID=75985 RepID=A0A378NES0_MANHA|nr:hypothetical protein [Mannheimia haemolytica]AGI35694.1 hypothetical protein D648_16900 [Mannheimia haemolytica USDA-ARS-USMARC-185]AGQ38338.1 hypothetical protein J450_04040 [Mannheimia haemolytica D171]EEY13094.1 hypothetical protein COK_0844 [Mannheimia haemolytica serotype A2 str. BOVINE]KYL11793.1 hypothetical protein AC568_01735 [Mannheimia haemolytica]KYL13817.1 hypothetical protein AC571_11760 [Mannheimia haemolytica]
MLIDIKGVLNLWGSFVRFTDCKGYPTMQAFMRESPQEREKQRYLPRLDDDTLAKVDRQIRKLDPAGKAKAYLANLAKPNDKREELESLESDELQFAILYLRYVAGLENKPIWQKLSLSKGAFENELRLAERFVEGVLIGSEIRLFL